MSDLSPAGASRPRVGLLVTCLVDLFRPSVGFASLKLLEDAGCIVEAPDAQTCCGQPAYNSGRKADTADMARAIIRLFEDYDYVVVPSGSCGGMVKTHYTELFAEEPDWFQRAQHLSQRTYELTSFLTDVLGIRTVAASYKGVVTYHDACSGLRELGVKQQPRWLLRSVQGLKINELPGSEVCCGFGGTFCVKYPEVSNRMVQNKAEDIATTGADTLLSGDMGCLLNMAGKLKRLDSPIRVRHIAEVLAGMTDDAPIGEGTA